MTGRHRVNPGPSYRLLVLSALALGLILVAIVGFAAWGRPPQVTDGGGEIVGGGGDTAADQAIANCERRFRAVTFPEHHAKLMEIGRAYKWSEDPRPLNDADAKAPAWLVVLIGPGYTVAQVLSAESQGDMRPIDGAYCILAANDGSIRAKGVLGDAWHQTLATFEGLPEQDLALALPTPTDASTVKHHATPVPDDFSGELLGHITDDIRRSEVVAEVEVVTVLPAVPLAQADQASVGGAAAAPMPFAPVLLRVERIYRDPQAGTQGFAVPQFFGTVQYSTMEGVRPPGAFAAGQRGLALLTYPTTTTQTAILPFFQPLQRAADEAGDSYRAGTLVNWYRYDGDAAASPDGAALPVGTLLAAVKSALP